MKTWVNRDAIVGKTIESCLINDSEVILSFTDGTYWSGLMNGDGLFGIEDSPVEVIGVSAWGPFVDTGVISSAEVQRVRSAAWEDRDRVIDDMVNNRQPAGNESVT